MKKSYLNLASSLLPSLLLMALVQTVHAHSEIDFMAKDIPTAIQHVIYRNNAIDFIDFKPYAGTLGPNGVLEIWKEGRIGANKQNLGYARIQSSKHDGVVDQVVLTDYTDSNIQKERIFVLKKETGGTVLLIGPIEGDLESQLVKAPRKHVAAETLSAYQDLYRQATTLQSAFKNSNGSHRAREKTAKLTLKASNALITICDLKDSKKRLAAVPKNQDVRKILSQLIQSSADEANSGAITGENLNRACRERALKSENPSTPAGGEAMGKTAL